MKKYKLGYLCSSMSWGGLEMNQLRNASWMKERGHSVLLFCRENSPISINAADAGVPIHFIDAHKKYYDFKAGKLLAKKINEQNITHLIVRDTRDMSVAAIAKRKSISPIHLSYFMEMQLGVKKKNLFHTIRFSYFDLWSCPLTWLESQVKEMTHFDARKIQVIPSGIDLIPFDSTTNKSEAREKLDLPLDKLVFGLIGRFDPHKGQLLLLEALKMIADPKCVVCLLGEPTKEAGTEYLEKMKAFIDEHELSDKVFIRPFRKDISTFYRAIDAFIMASKAETFGMVTVESIAAGTTVIASNAGGSPEILGFGRLGLLFEPMNASSLAAQMTNFMENPFKFHPKSLTDEARKYDYNKMCEKVEKALGI
ncbi:MAG: glycosyltransferase family 4 protein [Flavobacteriia bacterium]|jgi:glycosyltransferase involved in cell wall biosynthesis